MSAQTSPVCVQQRRAKACEAAGPVRAGLPACMPRRAPKQGCVAAHVSLATVKVGLVWPCWCACCIGPPRVFSLVLASWWVPVRERDAGCAEQHFCSAWLCSREPDVCTSSKYDKACVLLMDPSI